MQTKKNEVMINSRQCLEVGIMVSLLSLVMFIYLQKLFFIYLACFLLILDIVLPSTYFPIAWIWFRLSHFLGRITSKIFLVVIFFAVITPVGVIRKLAGKDALLLKKFKDGSSSSFKIRNYVFSESDFENMF